MKLDKNSPGRIRKAAVAGQFYPSNPIMLKEDVCRMLTESRSEKEPVKLLIVPHAGYVFSGEIAAKAYASIPQDIETVFIIGPSHHKWFSGVHVTDAHWYETPLGKVDVNTEITGELISHPECVRVTAAEDREHSIEVQLPFLQAHLSNFKIVPLITGDVDPVFIAELIVPFLNEKTIVVASSDLSHFLNQTEARKVDDSSIQTIVTGDAKGFIDGCGETAVRVVMELARRLQVAPRILDARTSFEAAPEFGSSLRVVGYASILYSGSNHEKPSSEFSQEEQKLLLRIARQSLVSAVYRKPQSDAIPAVPIFSEKRGCFVTLTSLGRLRGCIGYIQPIKPLYQAVVDNAVNAALHDPRFSAVKVSELDNVRIEISVLTLPQVLSYSSPEDLLSRLEIGVHGVILKNGYCESTFLPQVWDQLPDKVTFLEHLALKGGMEKDGWKSAEVFTYQAIHFSE